MALLHSTWHLLRASVIVDGRRITLFEEVHPRKHLTAFKVNQTFVKQLAALVPPCQRLPIATSAELWLNFQKDYELRTAREELSAKIDALVEPMGVLIGRLRCHKTDKRLYSVYTYFY